MSDRTATAEARALRAALDIDALLKQLAITQEEADLLNALAAGLPVQNGRLALAALKVKLEWCYPRPAQRVQLMPAFEVRSPYYVEGGSEPETFTVTPKHELPAPEKKGG
jgi:hypothetical protein